MNTKLGVLALFAGAGMVLVTVGSTVACSSSSGSGGATTSTGTAGTGTTTTSSTSTKAATGTTTTGAVTSSAATGGGQTCAAFCASVATACTGALNPFPNNDCATKCATVPAGMAGDTTGNTLGCRIYHVGVAGSSAANATTHCPHVGVPSLNTDGTAGGPCS